MIKTEPTTAVCALESCGKPFAAGRRLNHSGPRYCCGAHRQEAYRARRRSNGVASSQSQPRMRNSPSPVTSEAPLGVTAIGSGLKARGRRLDPRLVDVTDEAVRGIAEAVKEGRKDSGGPWTAERGDKAIALIQHHGMYRVRLSDGSLSDMVNLARATQLCRAVDAGELKAAA
jgi:hypothetical protein